MLMVKEFVGDQKPEAGVQKRKINRRDAEAQRGKKEETYGRRSSLYGVS